VSVWIFNPKPEFLSFPLSRLKANFTYLWICGMFPLTINLRQRKIPCALSRLRSAAKAKSAKKAVEFNILLLPIHLKSIATHGSLNTLKCYAEYESRGRIQNVWRRTWSLTPLSWVQMTSSKAVEEQASNLMRKLLSYFTLCNSKQTRSFWWSLTWPCGTRTK